MTPPVRVVTATQVIAGAEALEVPGQVEEFSVVLIPDPLGVERFYEDPILWVHFEVFLLVINDHSICVGVEVVELPD